VNLVCSRYSLWRLTGHGGGCAKMARCHGGSVAVQFAFSDLWSMNLVQVRER